MLDLNQIYNGDCLELMKEIDDKSIDMILCDLPYQVTSASWDVLIPFDKLWGQYERIIKDRGAIVLTATQPFTSQLVMSNPKLFKYEWIWEKNMNSNFQNAKRQPLKYHESVLVFYKNFPLYNPQGLIELDKPIEKSNSTKDRRIRRISGVKSATYTQTHTGYPKSILKFNCERGLHGTQKPIALFEYMIRTYSKEDDLILDNCAGSGTAGIAAMNAGRNFILMEKDEQIFEIAKERLVQMKKHNRL